MTASLRRYVSSPATQLEVAFRDIERTRMAGLPILNPALAVEAVGFRLWQGHWLGVLITPWFMNLVLVPGASADWRQVAEAAWVTWQLPARALRFHCIVEPSLGELHAHSLCSPVTRFSDQVLARAEAQRFLSQILDAPADPQHEVRVNAGRRAFLSRVSGRARRA